MKEENVTIGLSFIVGVLFAILMICCFAACSTPKWYVRTHDGCQEAQGFAGYGNK